MALNPITYTEKIVRSFLKYQLTAYPFADLRLHEQMRRLLNLDHVRHTPLLQGPYISLSRNFKQGPSAADLTAEGVLHPHMLHLIGSRITHFYGHQEKALRAIHARKTTLISTGTGSGKTECFLYPIISQCLELKDANQPAGISAVIVYPMNALAQDQLDRLRHLLAGSGIPFGLYIGKTPEYEREVTGQRLKPGSSRADYEAVVQAFRDQGRPDAVHPPEEVCSRQKMRTPGEQPRILLTNVKQLELLLTRQVDVELFDNARLDYLVFDEAHTFTGIMGAETACLIRRLRKFCGCSVQDTVCIATSATIVDQRDPDAGRRFASRFFGISTEQVECVHEEYEAEHWSPDRQMSSEPAANPAELLNRTLIAVDSDNPGNEIRSIYQQLTGWPLEDNSWQDALHQALLRNELAYQIHIALRNPITLNIFMSHLKHQANRPVTEEELLTYLALGAAAFREGRPVFRPIVHVFMRGIPGAVVTFPERNEPRLWLSSEEEIASLDGKDVIRRFPVYTCTTCGQHYFITYLKDFEFVKSKPEGGQLAEGGDFYWESLDKTHDGKRVVLVDQVISQDEDEELGKEQWSYPIYLCRFCGSAHPQETNRCQNCGTVSPLVKLFAVRSNPKHTGYLSSCVSCKAQGKSLGRRYREPIREVRAVNVSDVHVIAQDMVHHAERQRLLLFADNRQDAAFQAGWMKDHARRFRLRRLMAEAMKEKAILIGDMVIKIDDWLDRDDSLSQALIPEVWRVVPKEGSGGAHEDERRHFLRIQVLREIATAANQQVGLEPWGRLKISYRGLDAGLRFIQEWSKKIGLPPEDLKGGIETLLDQLRRQRLLYDTRRGIFSRWWNEGDREIERGYMPKLPGPQGMKLRIQHGDDKKYVRAWLSDHITLVYQIAYKWGIPNAEIPVFLEALWDFLTGESIKILVPVTLKSNKDKPLANCSGVYQINSNILLLGENHGHYRCTRCRRKITRRTPKNRCMAWHCDGELEYIAEDPDNYDLQLLDQGYSMLRPEEHTAMVPQEQRDKFENWFKGATDRVNTLVCTPTLELGVDIGSLDSILLRNVPPLPANYWQRVGRAGRRHRMAVVVCYCRPVSHDRSYYNEPVKMLEGIVDPPAFNMRNEVLIKKHIHAAVITRLFQLSRQNGEFDDDRKKEIKDILSRMLPGRISAYLFEPDGSIRTVPFDASPFEQLVQTNNHGLAHYVADIFQQGWPTSDVEVTTAELLSLFIDQTSTELNGVLNRLRKRLQWAHHEIVRLNQIRTQYGTLDNEDDAHYKRCDRLIKKLKGVQTRQRRDAEGVDDINTYGVLAAEGFLPGYGLDTGTIVGMAEVPYWQLGSMDFDLPRPIGQALREYVPGNLIYANGHRFVARRFHREPSQERSEIPLFEINPERGAISETNLRQNASSLGSITLRAISICDVDLIHQSQISDEEETRFQMLVSIFGKELNRHNGGFIYSWGEKQVMLRRGVHLRLVNVGSSPSIEQRNQFGYPVCIVCGYSVSPLSSDRQMESFGKNHSERCGRTPEYIGFYADVNADCLSIPACPNRIIAYSVLEAIRMAATRILDMHLEDLQILVIGHIDRDEVDGFLWDPMPGGSGLLDQIKDHFPTIIPLAKQIVDSCPSACEHACVDCLHTFRNSYYHKYLDRHEASEMLKAWGENLREDHPIPPAQSSSKTHDPNDMPVNDAETKLKHLLEAAGFTSGEFQHHIRFQQSITLDHQIGSTTPDVFFAGDEDDEDDKGVLIYLDGLSTSLHGNPETAERDREIRSWLRNNGYQVIEITYVELDDRNAMIRHFKKLARYLSGKEMSQKISEDTSWFDQASEKD